MDIIVLFEPEATAQKRVPFQTIFVQEAVTGRVLEEDQFEPSVERPATAPEVANVQKLVPFQPIVDQGELPGSICVVQLIPSRDVAAVVVLLITAQKRRCLL